MLNYSGDKDRKIHVKHVFYIPNIDMSENFKVLIILRTEKNEQVSEIKKTVNKYDKHRFTNNPYINSKLKRFR